MKGLYEFLENKYEQFGNDMSLKEFMENFIVENFGIGSVSEGLLDDDFLFYYEKSYRIDNVNKRIEFLFEESQ